MPVGYNIHSINGPNKRPAKIRISLKGKLFQIIAADQRKWLLLYETNNPFKALKLLSIVKKAQNVQSGPYMQGGRYLPKTIGEDLGWVEYGSVRLKKVDSGWEVRCKSLYTVFKDKYDAINMCWLQQEWYSNTGQHLEKVSERTLDKYGLDKSLVNHIENGMLYYKMTALNRL